jgi:hypothetical protein
MVPNRVRYSEKAPEVLGWALLERAAITALNPTRPRTCGAFYWADTVADNGGGVCRRDHGKHPLLTSRGSV